MMNTRAEFSIKHLSDDKNVLIAPENPLAKKVFNDYNKPMNRDAVIIPKSNVERFKSIVSCILKNNVTFTINNH